MSSDNTKACSIVDQLKKIDKDKYSDVMVMSDDFVSKVLSNPSGIVSLDIIIGGGYPQGRIIEVYGPEASGKTTTTLHAIAAAQLNGGTCVFIDAEHSLDVIYASRLGVDLSTLIISQPDCGEDALQMVEDLSTIMGPGDLIVVDSVAALTPKAEINGDMGDPHMGLQARLMSQAMRKLAGAVSKSGVTVIFINQIRMKIGVMFGSPETTTGGNALKFYASIRIEVRNTGKIKKGNDIIGNGVRFKAVKNKVYPPHKEAETGIRYGRGIPRSIDILTVAKLIGLLDGERSWYSYKGNKIGQGLEKAANNLESDNPELMDEIEKEILKCYKIERTGEKKVEQ